MLPSSVEELAKLIDHTYLKPNATKKEINNVINDALKFGFRAICIPPYWVKYAKKKLEDSNIRVATVVGFPLGYVPTEVKLFEAEKYLSHGADDLDVVMNISAFKNRDFDYIKNEIREIVKLAKPAIVKIIIGTDYLDKDEITHASKIVVEAGADYVKTNTGFGLRGVTVDDIITIRKAIGEKGKIKASGGIRNAKTALELIKNGANIIGTSSGVKILETFKDL